MDGGQYRPSRQPGRGVVNGSDASSVPYRQPETPSVPTREERTEVSVPQPPVGEPRRQVVVPPKQPKEKEKGKSPMKLILGIVIGVVVAVLGVAGWLFATGSHTNTATGIDTSKYQAVFFTNGQVYFGKLAAFNSEYMKLTDIYYLQTQATDSTNSQENPQKTSSDTQANIQLIKLGDEIHGPEDEMMVAKDQMLFYENLKTDSKVVQSIQKYKSSH